MTIVILTGGDGGAFYSGSLSNTTTFWSNPGPATTLFTANAYKSSSIAEAQYAQQQANATTASRRANIAQTYTFNTSSFSNITNVVATWKGYITGSAVTEATLTGSLYYWSSSAWQVWVPSIAKVNTQYTQNMGNASAFMSGSYIVFGLCYTVQNNPDTNVSITGSIDYIGLQITYSLITQVEQLLKIAPKFQVFGETLFQIDAHWITALITAYQDEIIKALPRFSSIINEQIKISPRLLSHYEELIKTSPKLQNYREQVLKIYPKYEDKVDTLLKILIVFGSHSEEIIKFLPKLAQQDEKLFRILVSVGITIMQEEKLITARPLFTSYAVTFTRMEEGMHG